MVQCNNVCVVRGRGGRGGGGRWGCTLFFINQFVSYQHPGCLRPQQPMSFFTKEMNVKLKVKSK